ncbi:MAG: hypothetical protein QNJ92_11380 [Alphaproteobacteria bacterium]|nr:hypothetical protein [Alphaproteobacteria bacterium]
MIDEGSQRLHRALNYPYAWPGACYLFRDGSPAAVPDRAAARDGRTPVLAYGSNKAPEQLRRKFWDAGHREEIFVEQCRVAGWDVVHSAHIARYGAIPAALHEAHGVTASVAVTWLSEAQLEVMDASEGAARNYGRVTVTGTVTLADGTTIETAETYRTKHGPVHLRGEVVAHADIDADGRTGPVARTEELLRQIHAVFDPMRPFEAFVHALIDDAAYRVRVTERLKIGL